MSVPAPHNFGVTPARCALDRSGVLVTASPVSAGVARTGRRSCARVCARCQSGEVRAYSLYAAHGESTAAIVYDATVSSRSAPHGCLLCDHAGAFVQRQPSINTALTLPDDRRPKKKSFISTLFGGSAQQTDVLQLLDQPHASALPPPAQPQQQAAPAPPPRSAAAQPRRRADRGRPRRVRTAVERAGTEDDARAALFSDRREPREKGASAALAMTPVVTARCGAQRSARRRSVWACKPAGRAPPWRRTSTKCSRVSPKRARCPRGGVSGPAAADARGTRVRRWRRSPP
jgi:hypothetical protein